MGPKLHSKVAAKRRGCWLVERAVEGEPPEQPDPEHIEAEARAKVGHSAREKWNRMARKIQKGNCSFGHDFSCGSILFGG